LDYTDQHRGIPRGGQSGQRRFQAPGMDEAPLVCDEDRQASDQI
jgi:hypothetical protein